MSQPRRKQKPITIRSDRAAARLALLAQNGRSQADIVEEALDRMPLPDDDIERRRAELEEIIERIAAKPRRYRSMAEFDRAEYDERGNPR